ncbi:MAG: hypothetical protein ACI4JU_00655 [Angelakisella sp.]
MKKISKILTFILVLAMMLSTVAMADDTTSADATTYTVTAGTFANGRMTLKYGDKQEPMSSGASVTVNKGTEITVELAANAGYEIVKIVCSAGGSTNEIADGGKFTVTGDTTITPVFQAKSTLGGEKTADSFRLDAICSGSYYWQMYHKDMANNKKYTKYPGSPADKVNPSSEIVKGNYVDLTLYVTDSDFLSLAGSNGYSKDNFSVTTPGDSSFLAGSGAGAEIEKWTVNGTDKGMVIQLTGVYYVGGSDNTLKLIVTQGNYNAILSCKIDNATIHPETPDDSKDNNEPVAAQPYVIISSYSYGKGDLVAGETRNVTMTFRNTSKTMAVENMMVTITMPDAMMLTSSSNSFYIESLAAEGTITKTVNVTVKPTAAAQSHSMTLDFTYDYMDGSTRRNAKTTETISMPVLQVDRFTVTGIDLSPQIFIGEETGLSVNFVNKSRTEIYNLSAKLSCEALTNNGEEQYLGNLGSGTTSSADFYITPSDTGDIVGEVIITYEDTNMNQRTVTVPFTTKAMSYEEVYGPMDPGFDPGFDPGMVEEPTDNGGFPWFWVVAGVVVLGGGAFVLLKLRKNKKESVDDDEDI